MNSSYAHPHSLIMFGLLITTVSTTAVKGLCLPN